MTSSWIRWEDDDFVLPKKPLLKRVANRFRAKKRPQEPADLKFEVNSSLRISRLKARIIFLYPRFHREGWSDATVPASFLHNVPENDCRLHRGNIYLFCIHINIKRLKKSGMTVCYDTSYSFITKTATTVIEIKGKETTLAKAQGNGKIAEKLTQSK